MKKMLFVTGSMVRGGAERVISILSNYYCEHGWQVKILMLLNNKVEYDLHSNIELLDASHIGRGVLRVPRLIKETKKYIRNNCPDVVLSFMGQIALITHFAAKGYKGRLIMSERIDPAKADRSFVVKHLLDVAYSKCDCTVLQTQRAWAYFPEKVQKNSVIIGNPISVKCEAAEIRKKKIVTAGRLTEQKNHKMLIEAFSEIHKKHPEYTLEIYGEGPLRAELEALVRDKGLEGAIFLPGNVSNLHECISDAKMFVLSSDYEGLSNALLEAMMMGLPCISTDCSGSDEVIKNGENGLLIPVGDKEKLVSALTKLIEDDEYREKLGVKAKMSVEKYKVGNIINQWDEVIEQSI